MRATVPQFIDVEDRVIGPLTIKQFLYLLAGGIERCTPTELFRAGVHFHETVIAGAHRVEGEVARLGAVTASMSAGDLVRAVQLARGPSSASCAAGCARGDSGSLGAISFAR